MGVTDDLGTIESGKLADLTFVEGNPLENIKDAANVKMVMKNGDLNTVDEIMDPYKQQDDEINASKIMELVEEFEEEGEFENDDTIRTLTTHLTAVSNYEEAERTNKVIKHMKVFKRLIHQFKKEKVISMKAYKTLHDNANTLLEKWQ